jgi:hypothetical protein
MLTFVESISLAGDRAKQNDDACGASRMWGWVIDGATDLHQTPINTYASDAAWIATALNERLAGSARSSDLYGAESDVLREEVRTASEALRTDWACDLPLDVERWELPTASMLLVSDTALGVLHGIDLGDCRCFVLDAEGNAHTLGGSTESTASEASAAADAAKRTGGADLLRDQRTLLQLREKRALHNTDRGYWVFGLQPECADHARPWTLNAPRPAHLVLCTDGFSALVDRYQVYDAAGLVRAALDKGLQELGRELRAIEAQDSGGTLHPRFKKSDDATALLLRLS